MKISYKWLKDYIDLDLTPDELEEALTFSGIEVEAREEIGTILKQIIVVDIQERKAHPNSDHLSICQVFDGREELQIICGAPNCAAGSKAALAPIGCNMGEFEIKKTKLRGEYSFGMLCSEKELGISDNHDGIMNLPEEWQTGSLLSDHYDLSDNVYDVEITPNRPDLLGITGVARDLSALLHKQMHNSFPMPEALGDNIEEYLQLENQSESLCTRYTAHLIKGVKIGESPDWLKARLTAVGLRPINNVVDATNFVMYELGHPLHAFDYHLIAEHKIIIRNALENEEFIDLNNTKHKLQSEDLVIADPNKATALAGVIGAANSQIGEDTKDIVIEAANFKYSTVRKTSKRYAIFTDSAYRFERDLSDQQAEIAGKRCCELILRIAGGTLCEGMLDSYPNPDEPMQVDLRPERVEKVLSVKMSKEQIKKYLESLGAKLISSSGESLKFESPHYRKDLGREIDLIEELIRLYGYNNVETCFKPQKVMDFDIFRSKRAIADNLVGMGFFEAVNWSFGDPSDFEKLKLSEDDLRRRAMVIKNPLGTSFSIMKTQLLPDLLHNTALNLKHNQKEIKFFELNRVYYQSQGKLATEDYHLSGLMLGLRNPVHWRETSEQVDFYDVKGVLEKLLQLLRLDSCDWKASTEPWYQPGVGLDVYIQSEKVASCGKLDPKIAKEYEIDLDCYVFDLYLEAVYTQKRNLLSSYEDIVKYPPVLRDLSFLIDRQYGLEEIQETIRKINPELIKDIKLFDEYKGKNVPSEKRSLTFNLTFSSKKKTLNDKFIGKLMNKIIKELEKKYQIKMR